jgi:curved DNA-binding protein CbpA
VNQAYEIVGDKDKRAQFDRGEIDAEGKQKFQSRGFDGFSGFEDFGASRRDPGIPVLWRSTSGGAAGGFDDILNDILGGFGGRGGARGSAQAQVPAGLQARAAPSARRPSPFQRRECRSDGRRIAGGYSQLRQGSGHAPER